MKKIMVLFLTALGMLIISSPILRADEPAVEGFILTADQVDERINKLKTIIDLKLNVLSSCADGSFVEQGKRLDELERKVKGMQAQITFLHAIKQQKADVVLKKK